MNEIRRNTEKEKELVTAKFKMPLITMIMYGVFFLLFIIFFIVGISSIGKTEYIPYIGEIDKTDYFMITLGFFGIVFIGVFFVLQYLGLKKSSCILTDKVIRGITTIFVVRKTYSYRIDEIDNVELISSLGEHNLKLNFTQGNGKVSQINFGGGIWGSSGNFFIIKYIKNYQEVYEKLTQVLLSVKNEKDLMVDIEMAKIQVQREQVQAISDLATAKSETKINEELIQLEKLAEMLKAGIITQEEFDAKKKKILSL